MRQVTSPRNNLARYVVRLKTYRFVLLLLLLLLFKNNYFADICLFFWFVLVVLLVCLFVCFVVSLRALLSSCFVLSNLCQ